jgi:para-aminobenzoate synthetase/4-amino-4-deoxychorismate lyase
MDVISALESTARQTFCGAIGFASPAAGLELSVAIRTFECRDGLVWLDVGGGVVADSDPDAEAAECLAKARPLLAAIGATLAADDAAPPAAPPVPLRLGVHPVARPDPAQGIFETVLVREGVAAAAEHHLLRLARSAQQLYDVALPAALPALLEHAALEQGGPCRLRVVLSADGEVALEAAPLPASAPPATLQPVTLPGGLGAHKWRDRRLIAALDEAVAPAVPLLVDLDGIVLETTRANVFIVHDGALITPPLDGRILPGITRARVLAAAEALGMRVTERPVTLGELATADAVLTSGALRGLEAVAAIGTAALAAPDGGLAALLERFAVPRA